MSKLLLGILGEGISYSLSPRIFEWAFRETGVDGEYRIYDLPQDEARAFLQSGVWHGLNVTTPHKEFAANCCVNLSARAQQTRAVNVVTRSAHGVAGDNTDVEGFKSALNRLAGASFRPELILVVGSGGAAKAALCSLGEEYGSARVEVASRNPDASQLKLDSLLSRFASSHVIDVETAAHFLRDFDTVIQASSVGSVKVPGCPLPGNLKFRQGAVVLEMIYAPRKTDFMEFAARSGARVDNGVAMLIAQAHSAFNRWTAQKFPLDKAMDELILQLQSA
jgi:shikimate dehydrogenase